MARLGPLVLLFGLLSNCGGASVAPPAHITALPSHRLQARQLILGPGERRTFAPGALRPGDVVTCLGSGGRLELRIPNRPYGGWSVGKGIATRSGKTDELQASSAPDGSVTATCRR